MMRTRARSPPAWTCSDLRQPGAHRRPGHQHRRGRGLPGGGRRQAPRREQGRTARRSVGCGIARPFTTKRLNPDGMQSQAAVRKSVPPRPWHLLAAALRQPAPGRGAPPLRQRLAVPSGRSGGSAWAVRPWLASGRPAPNMVDRGRTAPARQRTGFLPGGVAWYRKCELPPPCAASGSPSGSTASTATAPFAQRRALPGRPGTRVT
jgi:hypothetical protein